MNNHLSSIANSLVVKANEKQSEQGLPPLQIDRRATAMARLLSIASSLYAEDLPRFIEQNFEILPKKNKYRLGIPTRLFSHLFSYRFMQDFQPTDLYQLGEKRITDPRYANRKKADNVMFVSHVMKNLYPDLKSQQINCPHPLNPKAKKKRNLYAQVRCFDRLVPKKDSEFLSKEISAIAKNQNHLLNPLVESWLMKQHLLTSPVQPAQRENPFPPGTSVDEMGDILLRERREANVKHSNITEATPTEATEQTV